MLQTFQQQGLHIGVLSSVQTFRNHFPGSQVFNTPKQNKSTETSYEFQTFKTLNSLQFSYIPFRQEKMPLPLHVGVTKWCHQEMLIHYKQG